MNDRKAFAYFRVGNAEQLGETTDNRVFLYCRQSYDDSHFMNQQQEHLLRHCADKGYQAAGSTAVVASAKDEKENMLRLAERLKSDGIKTMLISHKLSFYKIYYTSYVFFSFYHFCLLVLPK